MTRKTDKMPALTPHEKRLCNTDRKLREALERLVKGLPTHPDLQKRSYRLTVATLAREARVGRNAIYANHRDILDALIQARRRQSVPDRITTMGDTLAEQRGVIDNMQQQIRQVVTENAGLLQRAIEAERRAERAERRSAQLTEEIYALRGPAMLRTSGE